MARALSVGRGVFWACSRFGGPLMGALVMMGMAIWIVRESPVWARGHGSEAVGQEQPAVSGERERFMAEVERRLKGCHERVAEVGASVLAGNNEGARGRDGLTNQMIATRRR